MARIGFARPDRGDPARRRAGQWGTHLGQSVYLRDFLGRATARRRRSTWRMSEGGRLRTHLIASGIATLRA
jgi:hypothetical protein